MKLSDIIRKVKVVWLTLKMVACIVAEMARMAKAIRRIRIERPFWSVFYER